MLIVNKLSNWLTNSNTEADRKDRPTRSEPCALLRNHRCELRDHDSKSSLVLLSKVHAIDTHGCILPKIIQPKDTFDLYDLLVEVVGDPATYVCRHVPGPAFQVEGEDIVIIGDSHRFSQFALAQLLPFFPAKQRETHKNDWMTSDAEIRCSDPHCGAIFRITRLPNKRTFSHAETTRVPIPD